MFGLSKIYTGLIGLGLILALAGGLFAFGYIKGDLHKGFVWAKAEQKQYEKGVKAHDDAEAAVPQVTEVAPPVSPRPYPGRAKRVCNDRHDRDCH